MRLLARRHPRNFQDQLWRRTERSKRSSRLLLLLLPRPMFEPIVYVRSKRRFAGPYVPGLVARLVSKISSHRQPRQNSRYLGHVGLGITASRCAFSLVVS